MSLINLQSVFKGQGPSASASPSAFHVLAVREFSSEAISPGEGFPELRKQDLCVPSSEPRRAAAAWDPGERAFLRVAVPTILAGWGPGGQRYARHLCLPAADAEHRLMEAS